MNERLTSLPDAVDTDAFQPMPKDESLLRKLGIPENKKLIVYLGAMSAYQGVDLLLDALRLLADARSDFHALLMGYPESVYVAKASKMGLDDCVTFTGKIEYAKAARYLSLGDLAISPKLSATEANGKLLNYLACGLPIVATDNAVNRELLCDNAVYLHADQPEALRDCLSSLLDGEERRLALAERSSRYAVEKHSWLVRIKTLEKVYQDLV